MDDFSDKIIGRLPVHTAGSTFMTAVPWGVLEGVWAILKPYCNFQGSAPLPPVAQENQRRLLTLKEAADMLKVSKNTLNRYLNTGKLTTVSELAQKVKQERAFLFRALSLVNLAPDIIEAILNGILPSPKATAEQEEPATLTLSKLRKGFPEDWTEQRKLFGMK